MPVAEQSYKLKLKSLLQVTQAVNNNFSRQQLLKIFEGILKNQAHLKNYLLYSVNDKGLKIEFHSGDEVAEGILNFDIESYLLNLKDLQEVKFISEPMFFFNAIIPAHHKENVLAYLLVKSDNDYTDEDSVYQAEKLDIEFLQIIINLIFVALENKVLAKEQIKQEGVRKELELASELQSMLFPPEWNLKQNVDISAFHKTYQKVGGDYYDYFELNNEEIGLCIADVSGKGVSAAMLMANFQANVRALFHYKQDLKELVLLLNEKVNLAAKGEKFITAFLAKYNTRTRQLCYVNAGHNQPILVEEKSVKFLSEGCIGLGMVDDMTKVNMGCLQLDDFALLVCYTDGVTELQNDRGVYFGTENLKEIIYENRDASPEEINVKIIMKLSGFASEDEYQDDVALLTCRFL